MNNIQFFPAFVVSSLLCLALSEALTSSFSINGEFVYACGFSIVLYAIWCETYQTINSLRAQFAYGDLASFWLKYKELENSVLNLVNLKISLIATILNIFVLTSVILNLLTLIKTNLFIYKLSIQTLNKVKLKIKALPLQ
jgi:hypothetical protein